MAAGETDGQERLGGMQRGREDVRLEGEGAEILKHLRRAGIEGDGRLGEIKM
jgi:hypothetical protein